MTSQPDPKSVSMERGFQIERKQEQIREQIMTLIRTKKYVEKLPSVHALAKELGANFKTVNKVLNKLADEGLLYRKPGLGTVIKKQPSISFRSQCPVVKMRFVKAAADQLGDTLQLVDDSSEADIIRIIAGQLSETEGRLLPLNRFVGDGWRDVIPEEALRLFTTRGELYALPIAFSPIVIYVNPAFFGKRGLPVPTSLPSLPELLEQQNALSEDVYFMASPYAKFVLPFLWHNGLPLGSPAEVLAGLCEDATLEKIEIYRKLVSATWTEALVRSEDLFEAFSDGKIGMLPWGASLHQHVSQKKCAVTYLPFSTNNASGTTGMGEGLGIAKNCPLPEHAFSFLQSVLTDKVQKILRKEFIPITPHREHQQKMPEIFTEEAKNIVLWQESLPMSFSRYLKIQLSTVISGDTPAKEWSKNFQSLGQSILDMEARDLTAH